MKNNEWGKEWSTKLESMLYWHALIEIRVWREVIYLITKKRTEMTIRCEGRIIPDEK